MIPEAVLWYTGEADGAHQYDDEDDDEDEDEDDDEVRTPLTL